MRRRFVVISGLPASGKTTLGRELAAALDLPLIDKDAILDRLFETRGVGDAVWRRKLSRESDVIFQAEAAASEGAVLVSHWRLPGMAADSGTDASWLSDDTPALVHVRCVCPPETAARRYLDRRRHPGHLDAARSYLELVTSFESAAALGPLDIVPRIDFDTSEPRPIAGLIEVIRAVLATPSGSPAPTIPL
jgi:glucokinase